MKLKNFKN